MSNELIGFSLIVLAIVVVVAQAREPTGEEQTAGEAFRPGPMEDIASEPDLMDVLQSRIASP